MPRKIRIKDRSADRGESFGAYSTTRSKRWKACFKLASRHRKSHAGFDRALHACLARNFGDAEAVHSGRGSSAADNASSTAALAVESAMNGNCGVAFKRLFSAHGWLGHAVAHSGAGARGVSIGPAAETVSRADARVLSRCSKK